MKRYLRKSLLFMFIILAYTILSAQNCYGSDYGSNNNQGNTPPPQSADTGPHITLPKSNQTLTAKNGTRLALSVTAEGAHNYSYQWQHKPKDGQWNNIVSFAHDKMYCTDVLWGANSGDQYRCLVTCSFVTGDKAAVTLTSPTFLVEVSGTSASGDGGTDVGPHTHTWSEHYEIKRHTTTENIIGYKCNDAKCGYSTENETLMIQHDRYNRAITPHLNYDSNVQIGTKVEDIIGYKCNGCDFVTTDYEAIHDHDWQNAPVAGHGGYDSNVQIGTASAPVSYQCNNCGVSYSTVGEIESHMDDCQPHDNFLSAMVCNTCGDVDFGSPEDTYSHVNLSGHTSYTVQPFVCANCCAILSEGTTAAHTQQYPGTYNSVGGSDPIYGYKCRGCGFTTQSEQEIKAHDAANQAKAGHGSFQRDVKIGTREIRVYGFVCKTCGHSTTDENAIKKHLADNPGQVGHRGYQSNVVIGTREVLLGSTRERDGWYCCICGARTDDPY